MLLLRAVQMGVSIADMELLTIGMVLDMYLEHINDHAEDEEAREATQADFNKFLR